MSVEHYSPFTDHMTRRAKRYKIEKRIIMIYFIGN